MVSVIVGRHAQALGQPDGHGGRRQHGGHLAPELLGQDGADVDGGDPQGRASGCRPPPRPPRRPPAGPAGPGRPPGARPPGAPGPGGSAPHSPHRHRRARPGADGRPGGRPARWRGPAGWRGPDRAPTAVARRPVADRGRTAAVALAFGARGSGASPRSSPAGSSSSAVRSVVGRGAGAGPVGVGALGQVAVGHPPSRPRPEHPVEHVGQVGDGLDGPRRAVVVPQDRTGGGGERPEAPRPDLEPEAVGHHVLDLVGLVEDHDLVVGQHRPPLARWAP